MYCHKEHENGYVCTLLAGHDGMHDASGVFKWPKSVKELKTMIKVVDKQCERVCLPGHGQTCCMAKATGYPYVCTMPKGHHGPHIACSTAKHNLLAWVVPGPPQPIENRWDAPADNAKPLNIANARTQKARGVAWLKAKQLLGSIKIPDVKLITGWRDLLAYMDWLGRTTGSEESFARRMFARPCPTRPRHGFVDSQPVCSISEVINVWEQARGADPEAELMIMPMINAESSGILTPNMLTIGPGHDGATGGHGSITLSLSGIYEVKNLLNVLDDYPQERQACGIYQTPYIELVREQDEEYPFAVQLRDGPSVNGAQAGNIIPRDVTVKRVLLAEGDLLDWETAIHKAAGEDGLVIHHPGGSALSHYAVHARLADLPVIFDKDAPSIGESLRGNMGDEVEYDIDMLSRGIRAAFWCETEETLQVHLPIAFTALHQGALTWRTGTGAWLLGYAGGLMLLAGMVSSIGEARYAWRKDGIATDASRDAIYGRVLNTRARGRDLLPMILEMYREVERWPYQFGGRAWANCTAACIKLDRAAHALCHAERKNQKMVKRYIAALNVLVNATHNGGAYLNKLISGMEMDAQANGYMTNTLRSLFNAFSVWEALKDMDFAPYPGGLLPMRNIRKSQRIEKDADVFLYAKQANGYCTIGLGRDHEARIRLQVDPSVFEAIRGKGLEAVLDTLPVQERSLCERYLTVLPLLDLFGFRQRGNVEFNRSTRI